MATKSKSSTVRVSQNVIKYVTEAGEMLKYPVNPGNEPRVSAIHTGKDAEFLAPNRGKLQKLQQKMA